MVQIGELVHIPVEPSFIDTTEDVKTLHYTKRNCTFDDEVRPFKKIRVSFIM